MEACNFITGNQKSFTFIARRLFPDELPGSELTPMNLLLRFLVVWFSIDVVVIATGWYFVRVINRQFPNWCKRVICDYGPEMEQELDMVTPADPMLSNDLIHIQG